MASRAILRRKKDLFHSLRGPTCLLRGSSRVFDLLDVNVVTVHSFRDSKNTNYRSSSSLAKEEVLIFSAKGFLRRTASTNQSLYPRIRETGFRLPLRVRSLAESVVHFSSAGTSKLEPDSGNDEKADTLKKEASPEECDEAVEGLTTAKAKAKAKQLQESKKDTRSILEKVWAFFLGIGPALRAVASMSRLKLYSSHDVCLLTSFPVPRN